MPWADRAPPGLKGRRVIVAPSDIPVPKGPRGTEGFQETLEILVPEVKLKHIQRCKYADGNMDVLSSLGC